MFAVASVLVARLIAWKLHNLCALNMPSEESQQNRFIEQTLKLFRLKFEFKNLTIYVIEAMLEEAFHISRISVRLSQQSFS